MPTQRCVSIEEVRERVAEIIMRTAEEHHQPSDVEDDMTTTPEAEESRVLVVDVEEKREPFIASVTVEHYPQQVQLMPPVQTVKEVCQDVASEEISSLDEAVTSQPATDADQEQSECEANGDDYFIEFEPVIPRKQQEEPKATSTDVESDRNQHENPEQDEGFLKQVKQKLIRRFHGTSDDEEFGNAARGSRPESSDDDDDGSSVCGEWTVRGVDFDDTDDEMLCDLNLEDSMTYPDELAKAIERYRRNDRTRLSRVKISRYHAALDMYVPQEYRVSHAALQRHVERTQSHDDAQQQELTEQRHTELEEAPEPGDNDQENHNTAVARNSAVPCVEGHHRISQLIDICKYQISDKDKALAGDDSSWHDKQSQADSASLFNDSERLDSISMRSVNSLYKNKASHDSDSMTSHDKTSSATGGTDRGKKTLRDSFVDSYPTSLASFTNSLGSVANNKAATAAAQASDDGQTNVEHSDMDSEQPHSDAETVEETTLTASQSCDALDQSGGGGRESRLSSLRRRLSKRLTRGLSLDNIHVKTSKQSDVIESDDNDAATDMTVTSQRRKKGWFQSLSRLKANKLKKSRSVDVLNDAEKSERLKKTKGKKSKEKHATKTSQDSDAETAGGGKLKKSKSILSLNRFRSKDKKTKNKQDSDDAVEAQRSCSDTDDDEAKEQQQKQKKAKKKAKDDKSGKVKGSEASHDKLKPKRKRKLAKGYVSGSSEDDELMIIYKARMRNKQATAQSDDAACEASDQESMTPSKAGKKANVGDVKSTESGVSSDAESMEFAEITKRLKAELKRSKQRPETETDTSDCDQPAKTDKQKSKEKHKQKHDDDVKDKKRHKKKKDKPKAIKGDIKRSTSKRSVADVDVDPKYSLEKVIRTITMCSADIL